MARGLTDEQKRLVKEIYAITGCNAAETARRIGAEDHQVQTYLRRQGLSVPPKRVTDNEISAMVEMYNSGLSTWKIGKELGYLNVCVIKHLKRAGVTLRDRSTAAKKISVTQDYFKSIDTPTKAYIFGLVCADGNVFRDSFTLALQERDKSLVELVAKEIGYEGVLRYRKAARATWQGMWVLRVHDKQFCHWLRQIGIVDRKTSHLIFPEWISPEWIPSFILGVLDGDGCIWKHSRKRNRYSVCFSGSEGMMRGIQSIVSRISGTNGKLYKVKTTRGYTLTFAQLSGLKIMKWLYSSHPSFCMERKKDKYFSILQEVHSSADEPHTVDCDVDVIKYAA